MCSYVLGLRVSDRTVTIPLLHRVKLSGHTINFKIIIIVFSLIAHPNQNKGNPRRARKLVPSSIAIKNGGIMHECFPKHLCMGTARMKEDKETEEKYKQNRVKMERSKVGTK